MPACAGHYKPSDPECDGDPVCAWRSGCRVYRDYCAARGVDPEVEKEITPKSALVTTIFALLHKQTPEGGGKTIRRVARGWDRFCEAFSDALPADLTLHLNRDVAFVGELYRSTWAGRREGQVRAGLIRVKTSGAQDFPIVRYWTVRQTRVEPDVEIRADLPSVLEAFEITETERSIE